MKWWKEPEPVEGQLQLPLEGMRIERTDLANDAMRAAWHAWLEHQRWEHREQAQRSEAASQRSEAASQRSEAASQRSEAASQREAE